MGKALTRAEVPKSKQWSVNQRAAPGFKQPRGCCDNDHQYRADVTAKIMGRRTKIETTPAHSGTRTTNNNNRISPMELFP